MVINTQSSKIYSKGLYRTTRAVTMPIKARNDIKSYKLLGVQSNGTFKLLGIAGYKLLGQ